MLKRLGEFIIKRKLGEGGMGEVYLAYQESLDREVALKVLNDTLCSNETFIARFKREARSAASIAHPSVIQIFSIGEENGIHYFAMEYVRGKDLTMHVAEGRHFTILDCIDIIMQVAEALSCASESGIVHRDIKPANIMLTENNVVKVTDFGLAKTDSSDMDVTEAGTILGTANYMSPEQGRGQPIDGRSDIYSLGVVFFELLAGRPPFIADHASAVLYMHIHEERPIPSSVNPDIPQAVDRMVMRMMGRTPEERPESAQMLISELRGLSQILGKVKTQSSESQQLYAAALKSPGEAVSRTGTPGPTPVLKGLPSGMRLKALVADDVAPVRKLYKQILSGMGFDVLEAIDGKDLLETWRDELPQLIIMDISMPKLDGMEVLSSKSAENLPGEVFVVSAHKERDLVANIVSFGVGNYLTKPVNIHEMRLRVQKVIDSGLLGKKVPILPASEGRRVAQSEVSPKSDTVINPGDSCVLVYDPSVYARRLYRSALEKEGHSVACVDTPAEAMKIIQENVPELMVIAVEEAESGGLSLLKAIKDQGIDTAVVAIAEENVDELLNRLKAMKLGPVMSKPVRMDVFREASMRAISRKEKSRVENKCKTSETFKKVVEVQDSAEQAYTIFDFATDAASSLDSGASVNFVKRIEKQSAREVKTTLKQLFMRLKNQRLGEDAVRYIKHGFVKGNYDVRMFAVEILPDMLDVPAEVDMLLKMSTDEDFRIRTSVLERLGELRQESALSTVVRFLNDEVWKVRKAAAACLEKFPLSKVIEPLIIFYARSNEPVPDNVRHGLMGRASSKEIALLEKLASSKDDEVRAFVAKFLGQLGSKLSVPMLLKFLKDKSPRVRAGASYSAGRIINDKLLEGLLKTLCDSNSEVQVAVIEALRLYKLTPAAHAFITSLSTRGRKISSDAVQFLRDLAGSEELFEKIITELWQQDEKCRKYLSLLLEGLFSQSDELSKIVKMLNSAAGTDRKEAIDTILELINESYGDVKE